MHPRRIVRATVPILIAALTACGGGGGAAPVQPAAPTATAAPAAPATLAPAALVSTSFALALAGDVATSGTARTPRFIGAGGKSATVTLTATTGNGGTIPTGLTTSVTSTITVPCPCSVAGPSVPPGQDTFTFNVYDGTNATGSLIATFSATYTIAAGVANTNTVTLNGVPATAQILGVPALSSGATASTPISIVVADKDGSTITGTYAVPLTVADNDSYSYGTLGQQVSVNGGTPGQTAVITKSSDIVRFVYGGLAESAATLGVYGPGNVSLGSVAVAPTNAAIGYSGPTTSGIPEIDLYATSGTGSTGSFSLSQVGYAFGSFTMGFTAYPGSGCSSIATVSPSVGATFTITALSAPVAGSCTFAFVNGASGQQKNVVVTYTSSQTGIQGKHRSTP